MINSYIPMEEIKDDLKKLSKEDLEKAMKKVDEDFVYTSKKETYAKLKNKLESIRVSGDKGELWNFEASFLLGILEGAEMNKKIAEKLADTLYEVFCLRPMTVSKVLRKQGFDDNKCEECEDSCYQCLLDWARKEVENEKE